MSEHLQVLRRADLVTEEVRGRERRCSRLTPQPLAEPLDDWLRPFERYWRGVLTDLTDHLQEDPGQ